MLKLVSKYIVVSIWAISVYSGTAQIQIMQRHLNNQGICATFCFLIQV